MDKILNKIKSENGFSLTMTILVLAVLTILAVILLSLSLSETTLAARQSDRKEAYYLARSGAEAVATYIIKNPGMDDELDGRTSNLTGKSSADTVFTNGDFSVYVEYEFNAVLNVNNVLVRGTATVKNDENTAMAILYRKTKSEIGYNAIYTGNFLDISIMKVTGDVQSGDGINVTAPPASNGFEDTSLPYTPLVIELDPFPTPDVYNNGTIDMPVLVVPNHSEVTITQNCRFDSLTIEQQGSFIVNPAANQRIDIVAEDVYVYGTLDIIPADGAQVYLYINNYMKVFTNGVVNKSHPKYLHIELADGSIFDMQANKALNGYITGPHADVYMKSDQSTINGYVIANSLTKDGTGKPNGAVNFIPEEDPEEVPEHVKAYKIVKWSE